MAWLLEMLAELFGGAAADRAVRPRHSDDVSAPYVPLVTECDDEIARCEELMLDCARAVGPEHPDTLATRAQLAGANREAGRLDAAIALYEPLLRDSTRVLGGGHELTQAASAGLAAAVAARERGRTDRG